MIRTALIAALLAAPALAEEGPVLGEDGTIQSADDLRTYLMATTWSEPSPLHGGLVTSVFDHQGNLKQWKDGALVTDTDVNYQADGRLCYDLICARVEPLAEGYWLVQEDERKIFVTPQS